MLRFSLNPRKDLSLDDLRIALFSYIVSKQTSEDLTIRIEDSIKDESREKELIELINLFSIDYKNIIYKSSNFKYHQKLSMQLLSQKRAFSCFCSEEKLEELRQKALIENKTFVYDGFCQSLSDQTVLNTNAPFCIRVTKPLKNIKFTDIFNKTFDFTPFDIDSFIILDKEKIPTDTYACAVDDMIINTSTVLSSQENISNTPKQIHIRESLNYTQEIKYAYIPKITYKNSQESSLYSVKNLIKDGYLPSAIANYLINISNETPKDIFTLEDAISWFELEYIYKIDSKFNIDELKLINKKHLLELDDLRLSKILGFADEDIGKLGKIFLQKVDTINEIKEKIEDIFTEKKPLKSLEQEFNTLKKCLREAPFFEEFEELKKYIIKNTDINEENLDRILGYILTKEENSSNISNIYKYIKNYLGEIIK